MFNNPKGQLIFSEHFGFSSFSGFNTINNIPDQMVDYFNRNPSSFLTLKNMDKYYEQKENKRGEVTQTYWCFPPMKLRTSSEKKKSRKQEEYMHNEENLNESEIDETSKIMTEEELEEEYIDFPDPMGYLIGFYASKTPPGSSYKTKSNKFSISQGSSSQKAKPPVVHSYMKDVNSKGVYKSYYNCKKPARPGNSSFSSKQTTESAIKSKYRVSSKLNNNSHRSSVQHSKTSEEEGRLCRTLGEEQMAQNRQESSLDRSSYERPSFDPYGSTRSYGYDLGSSFSKEKTYKPNIQSSSKNSYTKMKKDFGFEVSPEGQANSHRVNYSVNSSLKKEDPPTTRTRIPKEQDLNYTGVIAAGSGSVSSTKIKKEIEGRKKKKFKKIEYLNKSKVGVSNMHATTAIKIGSHTPSSSSGRVLSLTI